MAQISFKMDAQQMRMPSSCVLYYNVLSPIKCTTHSAGLGGGERWETGCDFRIFRGFFPIPSNRERLLHFWFFPSSFGVVWFSFIFVIDAAHGRGGQCTTHKK